MSWITNAKVTKYGAKAKALIDKLSGIDETNSEKNKEIFSYDGNTFYPDKDSIQSVQNACLALLYTGSAETDPIPVPNGVWKTADTEADGLTPVYRSFTLIEFLNFSNAFYMRSSENFGVKEAHKNAVKALVKDVNKKPEDIKNYNCEAGWHE